MTFLLHLLETEENEKIQALLCMGIAKLMLAGMITDERVSEHFMLRSRQALLAHALGAQEPCASLRLPRDGGQPGAQTMPGLLLPCLLLLQSAEPAAYAAGNMPLLQRVRVYGAYSFYNYRSLSHYLSSSRECSVSGVKMQRTSLSPAYSSD